MIENFDGSEVNSEDEVNLIKNQQDDSSIVSEEANEVQFQPEAVPKAIPEAVPKAIPEAVSNNEQPIIVNTDALQKELSQTVATPFNFIKRNSGGKWFWVVIGVIITAILIGIVVFIMNKNEEGGDFNYGYEGLYGGKTIEIPLNIKSVSDNLESTDFNFLN
jgi:ATP-dependent Zn protease